MKQHISAVLGTIYESGRAWLFDTVYAVMVLMLAITMPLWGLPYAVWKKSKERK